MVIVGKRVLEVGEEMDVNGSDCWKGVLVMRVMEE